MSDSAKEIRRWGIAVCSGCDRLAKTAPGIDLYCDCGAWSEDESTIEAVPVLEASPVIDGLKQIDANYEDNRQRWAARSKQDQYAEGAADAFDTAQQAIRALLATLDPQEGS